MNASLTDRASCIGIKSRILSTSDGEAWQDALTASESVFGSLPFLRATEGPDRGEGRLFVTSSPQASIVYPFYVRPLPASGGDAPGGLVDICSPQFTGPILKGPSTAELTAAFRRDFGSFVRQAGIVSEFAHLHPWDACFEALDSSAVRHDRPVIYVDTQLSDEDLWSEHFARSCRKNIKRAVSKRVEIVRGKTAAEVKLFHQIYTHTMTRRGAAAQYYYPLEFFQTLCDLLPENTRFATAYHDGRVVAATLYMHDRDTVYSYLGGADPDFQHLRPTNGMIYETIRWARSAGCRRLLLGGGFTPNDGIFRFKSTFSKLQEPFHVYQKVHDSTAYANACGLSSSQRPAAVLEGFFPGYRNPMKSQTGPTEVGINNEHK